MRVISFISGMGGMGLSVFLLPPLLFKNKREASNKQMGFSLSRSLSPSPPPPSPNGLPHNSQRLVQVSSAELSRVPRCCLLAGWKRSEVR